MKAATGKVSLNRAPSQAASEWLDVMRGWAALTVVVSHMNWILFTKLDGLPSGQHPWLHFPLLLIGGFARPAVMVFFVLSGFLVGGASLRSWGGEGRFDLIAYSVARLSRLWVVLLPAFALIAALNYVGAIWLAPGSVLYAELGERVRDPVSLAWEFVCNASFSSHCPTFGGDDPLWSLFNEFWYYAWWGVLMCMLSVRNRPALVAVCALCLVCALVYTEGGRGDLRGNVAIYFVVWLAGCAVVIAPDVRLSGGSATAAVLLFAVLIAWRLAAPRGGFQSFSGEFGGDVCVAAATAGLLHQLRVDGSKLARPYLAGWHRRLAECSFSLYVLHLPVLTFLAACVAAVVGVGPHMAPIGIGAFFYGLSAIVVCLAVALAFAAATERHTGQVRRKAVVLARSISARVLQFGRGSDEFWRDEIRAEAAARLRETEARERR